MIEKAGDGVMIVLKLLKSLLHAMIRGRLPYKFHLIWVIFLWSGLMVEQLKTDLFIYIVYGGYFL